MKLDAYWMPFTANRQFKKAPRLLSRSSGMHYWTHDGRQILDGVAGLWCVNAGHARPRIIQAIQEQAAAWGVTDRTAEDQFVETIYAGITGP